jgi:hypothetical protein
VRGWQLRRLKLWACITCLDSGALTDDVGKRGKLSGRKVIVLSASSDER